jgi:hypothetical protein
MIPKIFDISNEKVLINDTILRIPVLRNLFEKYKEEALDMFSVVWFHFDLESPYINIEEENKIEYLLKELGFEDRQYLLNDDFCELFDWTKDKYETTGERFWKNHKRNIENIGVWASTPVSGGKDGDASQKISAAKEAKRLYLELIAFENEVRSNMKGRGQTEIAYDL